MFFRNKNWDVVGWFRTVSYVSYAIIFAGLITMGYTWATKGYPLRLGLSFTGGTDVTVKFQSPVTKAQIADALATVNVKDAIVNTLARAGDAEPNERYTIQMQTAFGNDPAPLQNALGALAPIDKDQWSISSVGPSLSREYLIRAIEALVIAIAIQFVYIAFRFGWNYIFGFVVVVALVRDSLMMIGIYAMAGRRADDAFLAAVLTVIGYSVMDTIVILDRIRENIKVMSGEPFRKIVNTSILQTMTRSLNTLATVVITLVALLALGGASLQNFAFALLVGICSGGYHSIFFSAPLVSKLREEPPALFRWVNARLAGSKHVDELDKPRTVAEARTQAANAKERETVLAARKERRERERSAQPRGPAGPVRYKKKRAGQGSNASTPAVAGQAPEFDDEPELDETAVRDEGPQIDPLDAQNAGLHDEQLALGHEEIHLNFDEHEPFEHADAATEPTAATKPEK
jgi:preprotein translocase SecF subunit